jgi:hypothetical protein
MVFFDTLLYALVQQYGCYRKILDSEPIIVGRLRHGAIVTSKCVITRGASCENGSTFLTRNHIPHAQNVEEPKDNLEPALKSTKPK